jgi:hypothetical protein
MLGHAPVAMTLNVYANLFEDDFDAAVVALNDQTSRAVVGRTWGECDAVPLTRDADPQ